MHCPKPSHSCRHPGARFAALFATALKWRCGLRLALPQLLSVYSLIVPLAFKRPWAVRRWCVPPWAWRSGPPSRTRSGR